MVFKHNLQGIDDHLLLLSRHSHNLTVQDAIRD